MPDTTPRFSIVVPTLNQARYIGQTIASILAQAWSNTEIIVVDGGSTDGTHDVVKRFGSAVSRFVSEPDRGQADAINKGFRLATGQYLAWLNSDDFYLPLAFDRVSPLLDSLSHPQLAYGGTLALFESRHEAKFWSAPPFNRENLNSRALIYQPSAFWNRALWEATGELNLDYHFVLDWDWFRRASQFCEFSRVDEALSVYRFHDSHKTGSRNPRRTHEICAFVETHAGPDWGAAFRDVAGRLDHLAAGLDRLKRFGLFRWRTLFYRSLYKRHGEKVKVALSQLRV